MSFDFHPDLAAFRAEVRTFVRAHLPDEVRERFRRSMPIDRPTMTVWHAKLVEKGWAARGWPKEYGGAGLSLEQQYMFNQELASEGAPLGHISWGFSLVAPAVLQYGTEEQKQRFLPSILRGGMADGRPHRRSVSRERGDGCSGAAASAPVAPDGGRSGRPCGAGSRLPGSGSGADRSAIDPRRKPSTGRAIYSGSVDKRESGGTGRRAGFRCQWGNPWGFESPLSHQPRAGRPTDSAPCVPPVEEAKRLPAGGASACLSPGRAPASQPAVAGRSLAAPFQPPDGSSSGGVRDRSSPNIYPQTGDPAGEAGYDAAATVQARTRGPTLKDRPRLVVGISGASGVIYGIRLLELLRELPVETHLVMSKAAEMTIAYETDRKPAEVKRLATVCHPVGDIGASISSGSFRTLGMIIAPCSVRTMSEIATGVTASLLTRAADVALKERRRLVLLLRETPLHTGHLRTMLALSEAGGVIMPPVPAFYAELRSIDEMIDQTLGRALDLFGIEAGITKRWGEDVGGAPGERK